MLNRSTQGGARRHAISEGQKVRVEKVKKVKKYGAEARRSKNNGEGQKVKK